MWLIPYARECISLLAGMLLLAALLPYHPVRITDMADKPEPPSYKNIDAALIALGLGYVQVEVPVGGR